MEHKKGQHPLVDELVPIVYSRRKNRKAADGTNMEGKSKARDWVKQFGLLAGIQEDPYAAAIVGNSK
ncbi:hypothetical protein E3N88_38559 [Mikania micrantha]|uniref:Uncharacterized protein n=1 Tax=Mikania micrantha TaxID=192012 RepID=A0A5N6LWW1_9ASTR|nr:hypothetical protein E3N88_38559 [Mikania micrantha]